jgi:hypothetical protein
MRYGIICIANIANKTVKEEQKVKTMIVKRTSLDVLTTLNRKISIEFAYTVKSSRSKGHIVKVRPLERLQKDEGIKEVIIPSVLRCDTDGEEYSISSIELNIFGLSDDSDPDDVQTEEEESLIASRSHPIGRLIISEGISFIKPGAFFEIWADTVVWPHSCEVIARSVFSEANVSHFEGMEDVTVINKFAFSGNQALKTFNWPKNCTLIPQSCFNGCKNLKSVTGIENVEIVETSAFASCKSLEVFDWPVGCSEIPDYCFDVCESLRTLNIKGDISSIGEDAIAETKITELDLSNSLRCELNPYFAGFFETDNVKVILPFYQG